ncbi:MAG: sugar phosphate isomerase/epimerase family protein [Candidatus Fimadaptatus sp.]|jgi:sugar phosphate isomerase/epimerase
MKICVSSYSFTQYVSAGKLNPVSVMDQAKEIGFDGIEYATDKATIEKHVPAIVEKSRDLDLPVVCYLTSADFVGRDFEGEVARLREEVDIAAALGVKLMRHDTTWAFPKGATFEDILPIISEGCRRVTEYAQTRGIRTMVENHGLLVQDSERVVALYRAVGHENFSLLADMGNFMCADENSAHALGNVLPYAAHMHAKDFIFKSGDGENPGEGFFCSRAGNYLRGTIIGHGAVPVTQCLKLIKRSGYDGWLSVEFEGMEDCITGCRIGLENLRRMCGGVGL